MRCPFCNTEIADGIKFCHECGGNLIEFNAQRAQAEAEQAQYMAQAEAEQQRAQAEAEQTQYMAQAEAEQQRAQAEAEQAQYMAQAEAEQQRAQAEAEQQRAQAEAEQAQYMAQAETEHTQQGYYGTYNGGFAQPQNNYGAPQNTAPQTQNGYGAPQNTAPQTQNGYGAPQNTAPQTQNGYGAYNGGYAQYGQTPYQYSYTQEPKKDGKKGFAIASFLIGFVNLVTCGLFSVIGFIFGLIGVRSQKKGLSIAGIVMNAVFMFLFVTFIMGFIAGLLDPTAAEGFEEFYYNYM